jgi:hypothetical protein
VPCLFWDSLLGGRLDNLYSTLLVRAHERAPEEFLQALSELIEGQNERFGAIFCLGRIAPTCDQATVRLLQSKLQDDALKPEAFRAILSFLIKRGDSAALKIAINQVKAVTRDSNYDLRRALIAACQLLLNDPAGAWEMVWSAAHRNPDFARGFFVGLEQDYHGGTGELLLKLSERQLADIYIWLAQHGPLERDDDTWASPGKRVSILKPSVISLLSGRHTPAACWEIRRIMEAVSEEALEWHFKSAEELMRQHTWEPLSPSELIALASVKSAGAEPQPEKPTPLAPNTALQIMRTAMERHGLNPPKLAKEVRAVLKRRRVGKLKVDKATIYRILNGETRKPDPTLRNALIEVLKLSPEDAKVVVCELGRT